MWERVLIQSFDLLADSNDEPLAATIDFIFKTASQCQLLPEAVCISFSEYLIVLSSMISLMLIQPALFSFVGQICSY